MDAQSQKKLARVIGCAPDVVAARLEPFHAAAAEEYERMMLGERVFTRGSDILEYRLLLMIKHVFQGLPSEAQVSALFQTSASRSRSLLRAVMSKYQYEVESLVESSLVAILKGAVQNPGTQEWEFVAESGNVVEALNQTVAQIDGRLPAIVKKVGTASVHVVAEDTFAALRKSYGVGG